MNDITKELLSALGEIKAYDDLFIPSIMACLETPEDQEVMLDFLKHGRDHGHEVSDETVTMLAIYLNQERNGIE